MLLRHRKFLWVFLLMLAACMTRADAPALAAGVVPDAFIEAKSTELRVMEASVSAHPGESGFRLMPNGSDALLTRLAIIEHAARTLDMQYYSFEDDQTGLLVLAAILRAADRGVKVRLLLDDLSLTRSGSIWSTLAMHENIQIRIFNPLMTRSASLAEKAGDLLDALHFSRRMHNKALVADGALVVLGGRNIGDNYFDASADFNFRDLDVVAAGPIAGPVTQSFNAYWNHEDEVVPLNQVSKPEHDLRLLTELRAQMHDYWQEAVIKKAPPAEAPPGANQQVIWAKAELAADKPAKADHAPDDTVSRPGLRLDRLASAAEHEFLVVSPYFVPGDDGVEWLQALEARGVKVKILTNSLAATDVIAVHAGYRQYRQTILENGAELYELKPLGRRPRTHLFGSSSRASLHTKAYVIDRQTVVLGSFNLDPRSIKMNTEIALVIHSPELAAEVAEMFVRTTQPASSYHVVLKNGDLEWDTEEKGKPEHYSHDPDAGFWRNVKVNLLALLPIEGQL